MKMIFCEIISIVVYWVWIAISQLLNYDSAVRCCPRAFQYFLHQIGSCYGWVPNAPPKLTDC